MPVAQEKTQRRNVILAVAIVAFFLIGSLAVLLR